LKNIIFKVYINMPVGMFVQSNPYTNTIASRTEQSGGSLGGNKKAGIVVFGTTWQRGNMGNYLKRAPQRIPSVAFALRNTTRRPVQGTRYQVYARRGIM
jgi:hypothetical protein